MIAFFRGTGLIGSLIRWQTMGPYSHAAWICMDGSLIEAWHLGGVRHVENPFVAHGDDAVFDVYAVKCLTGGQHSAAESFMRRQVGAGYDFLAILRFLSRVNRNNYNRWFCSELVAEGLEEAGRPMLKTDAYRISPNTLSWSTEIAPVQLGADVTWWEKTFGRRADPAVRHFDNWGIATE